MNNKQILILVFFVFMQNVGKVYSSEYETDENDKNTTNTDNNFIAADSDEQSTIGNHSFSSELDSGEDDNGANSQKVDELNDSPNEDEILDVWYLLPADRPDEYLDNNMNQASDEDEEEILYDDEFNIIDYNPIAYFLCNTCYLTNTCCNPWSFFTFHLCCQKSQRPNDPGTTKKPAVAETTLKATTQEFTTQKATTQDATTKPDTKTTQESTTKKATTKPDTKTTQKATSQMATTKLATKTTESSTTQKETTKKATTQDATTKLDTTTKQESTTQKATTQKATTTTKPK